MHFKGVADFKTILIADSQAVEKYKTLLDSFKESYDKGFPDADEREDFKFILERICCKNEIPRSTIVIYYALDVEKVLGGLVVDWYGKIGALHLTYLIVDPQARKRGIAKKLINIGIPMIINYLSEVENVNIRSNFFESNNPLKTTIDNFDPQTRLKIFSALGAKTIPIDYVQPSLGEDKSEVSNLLLLTFSQFNAHKTKMPIKDIVAFLREFYRVSPHQKDDSPLQQMERQLNCHDPDEEYLEPESIMEKPAYFFDNCSITNHFFDKTEDRNVYSRCDGFFSFETDLFNYMNQANCPFSTCFKKYAQDVQIKMPAIYSYTSEGRTHFRLSEKQVLDVNISISQTKISNDNNESIIHFTIAPQKGTKFSELDIIKLSSSFVSRQEQVDYGDVKEVFVVDSTVNTGQPTSIPNILSHYLGGSYEHLNTGIIQLVTDEREKSGPFFKAINSSKFDSLDESTEDFANMVCGITLGIFDFNRMDIAEIEDTIRPFCKTPESFYVLCRGALLAITSNKELLTVTPSVIVSPYLLLPNTVLAYNRHILDEAERDLEKHLNDKMHLKMKILELQECREGIGKVLNEYYLKDIFQYSSEQEIINHGNQQRGINTSLSKIKSRQTELSELIAFKHKVKSNRSAALLNTLLGMIAFIQIKFLFDQAFDYFGYGEVSFLFYFLVPVIGCIIYHMSHRSLRTENIKSNKKRNRY